MKIRTIVYVVSFISQAVFSQRQISTDLLSIDLPPGWILISNETVDFLRNDLNYTIQFPVPTKKFDQLLQRKSSDSLFVKPYFLIQQTSSGRLAKSELQSFNSPLFTFDPQTNYLWGYRDTVIEVIIPTEEGTINVFCYSSPSDLKKNKDRYTKIINSISVNPDLWYRESIINDTPVLKMFFKDKRFLEQIGLTAVIVLFTGIILRKKRTRNAL